MSREIQLLKLKVKVNSLKKNNNFVEIYRVGKVVPVAAQLVPWCRF